MDTLPIEIIYHIIDIDPEVGCMLTSTCSAFYSLRRETLPEAYKKHMTYIKTKYKSNIVLKYGGSCVHIRTNLGKAILLYNGILVMPNKFVYYFPYSLKLIITRSKNRLITMKGKMNHFTEINISIQFPMTCDVSAIILTVSIPEYKFHHTWLAHDLYVTILGAGTEWYDVGSIPEWSHKGTMFHVLKKELPILINFISCLQTL